MASLLKKNLIFLWEFVYDHGHICEVSQLMNDHLQLSQWEFGAKKASYRRLCDVNMMSLLRHVLAGISLSNKRDR